MEIILVRHGKPDVKEEPRITSTQYAEWIKEYDASGIGQDTPPKTVKILATGAKTLISSSLPRALASLSAIGREPEIIEELFREAELPVLPIPYLKLSTHLWGIFLRISWLCGFSKNTESIRDAKKRAARAALMLIENAKLTDGPVLLMGHGIMNRLIGKELSELGFRKVGIEGMGYWEVRTYRSL